MFVETYLVEPLGHMLRPKWNMSSKELAIKTYENLPYHIVEKWCYQFKCGRQSCKSEYASGTHKQSSKFKKMSKKLMILCSKTDRWLLSNIIAAELNMKKKIYQMGSKLYMKKKQTQLSCRI